MLGILLLVLCTALHMGLPPPLVASRHPYSISGNLTVSKPSPFNFLRITQIYFTLTECKINLWRCRELNPGVERVKSSFYMCSPFGIFPNVYKRTKKHLVSLVIFDEHVRRHAGLSPKIYTTLLLLSLAGVMALAIKREQKPM